MCRSFSAKETLNLGFLQKMTYKDKASYWCLRYPVGRCRPNVTLPATHCNTLQHSLQHTATHNTIEVAHRCGALLPGCHAKIPCNTLEYTATPTATHTATHTTIEVAHRCRALQPECRNAILATQCNTLQRTLQRTKPSRLLIVVGQGGLNFTRCSRCTVSVGVFCVFVL